MIIKSPQLTEISDKIWRPRQKFRINSRPPRALAAIIGVSMPSMSEHSWFIVLHCIAHPVPQKNTMTTVAAPAMPVENAVEDALMRSIRIPPRPSLLVDLQRELAQSDPSPRRIARTIGNDVGMSGALLKLANSSYFGAVRKAKSVEQAINFLGIDQCAALLTGLLAREAIEGKENELNHFWEVSARRAQALVFISRRLRIAPADIAHTFGLFCDIGVPLLMNRFPDYTI